MRARRLRILLPLVLGACSDAAGPSPGTYRASLSGARAATLSGPAVAGTVFTQAGIRFTIQMSEEVTDSIVFLVLDCPGDTAPAPGTHPVGEGELECAAGYTRVAIGPAEEFIEVEHASAASGSLDVETSEPGNIAGSFRFSGPLVAEGETVGEVTAAGSFNAEANIGGSATRP